MRLKSIALILFFSFAFPAIAAAQTVVENIQRHYDNTSSMTADISQILTHKESGNVEKRSGIFIFKKPLLLKWETQSPSKELIMLTEDFVWNIFPEEDLAYKYSIDLIDNSHSILKVVTGRSKLAQDFSIESESKDGNLIKLHLYPNEPVQEMVEAFFWVEPFGMIKKLKVIDFFGNINEITFNNAKFGTAVPDITFTYNPPKNYEVEDRTKDYAGTLNLMN